MYVCISEGDSKRREYTAPVSALFDTLSKWSGKDKHKAWCLETMTWIICANSDPNFNDKRSWKLLDTLTDKVLLNPDNPNNPKNSPNKPLDSLTDMVEFNSNNPYETQMIAKNLFHTQFRGCVRRYEFFTIYIYICHVISCYVVLCLYQ